MSHVLGYCFTLQPPPGELGLLAAASDLIQHPLGPCEACTGDLAEFCKACRLDPNLAAWLPVVAARRRQAKCMEGAFVAGCWLKTHACALDLQQFDSLSVPPPSPG